MEAEVRGPSAAECMIVPTPVRGRLSMPNEAMHIASFAFAYHEDRQNNELLSARRTVMFVWSYGVVT